MKYITLFSFSLFFCCLSIQSNAQLEANDLTWDNLKQSFNELEDNPIILSILGVNCPPCRAHRNDIRDDIMNQCDNPDLRWLIIWFEDPGHPAIRADAESQAMQINDNRVSQWWYTEHQNHTPKNDSIAYLLGDVSWIGCSYAWDISMLFDVGSIWDAAAPQANYCMAKVGACCHFYSINNFAIAVNNLAVCDETTAINDLDKQNEPFIRSYPNPSAIQQSITIQYQIPEKQASVIVYDAKGRLIKTYVLTESKGDIKLSENLNKGLYYFALWVEQKRVQICKGIVF